MDLPTAILLSVRDQKLRPRFDSSGRYILTMPADGARPFYVVDGQHRLETLKKIMDKDLDGDWFDFKIPAVIIFGADESVEMDQFHTVNANAKSVSTALALDLLKTRAKKDAALKKYLIETGSDWKVICQELTERVARQGLWRGKIRFPNEAKASTVINSNSFVSSLKYAVGQENFSTYLPDQRAKIIDAYWQGIRKSLSECFEVSAAYNIQKTVGVSVFHNLLPTVLSYAVRFSSPVYEPNTYYNILDDTLCDLSGDNQLDGEAIGPDFWKTGAEGASGAYSSGAGQRVLTDKIKRGLLENLSEQLK